MLTYVSYKNYIAIHCGDYVSIKYILAINNGSCHFDVNVFVLLSQIEHSFPLLKTNIIDTSR